MIPKNFLAKVPLLLLMLYSSICMAQITGVSVTSGTVTRSQTFVPMVTINYDNGTSSTFTASSTSYYTPTPTGRISSFIGAYSALTFKRAQNAPDGNVTLNWNIAGHFATSTITV